MDGISPILIHQLAGWVRINTLASFTRKSNRMFFVSYFVFGAPPFNLLFDLHQLKI